MNDMPIRTEGPSITGIERLDFMPLKDAGQVFRGELLDKCALIEGWAVDVLKQAAYKAGRGRAAKLPHLFGQKIAAVRKIAECKNSPMQAPSRVIDLLDRLEPFTQIRSALAHSALAAALRDDGEALYIFEAACESSLSQDRQRLVFTREEAGEVIERITRLAKQLQQQESGS